MCCFLQIDVFLFTGTFHFMIKKLHISDHCFQLLGAVIQHEKPELEVQKSQLLKQEEELKIELAKLEEALLEVRCSAMLHRCVRKLISED